MVDVFTREVDSARSSDSRQWKPAEKVNRLNEDSFGDEGFVLLRVTPC